MKAVVIRSPGGAEVLELEEVEDPQIGEDQVLITIEAHRYQQSRYAPADWGPPPPKSASPYPDLECSGTILAVGTNVSRWNMGDPVHGGSSGLGTFAIQIAKSLWIRAFVTAGNEEKSAACKDLGADVCINYKTEDCCTSGWCSNTSKSWYFDGKTPNSAGGWFARPKPRKQSPDRE